MDRRLLVAATSGNTRSLKWLPSLDPGVYYGTTPQGNTCLHIASIHGYEEFCKHLLELEQIDPASLLTAVNVDGETPLLTAVTSGHDSLALVFLTYYHELKLNKALLKQDRNGCNSLHHAIRRGQKDLALKLIAAEPALSCAVNGFDESPMFIAVLRGFTNVFEKLLEIENSSHSGTMGYNALHAAVKYGNKDIAKKIMETRPGLAREEDKEKNTPMHLALHWDKFEVLRELIDHDWTLGYVVATNGNPLLVSAAFRGHVGVARELLKHCPDAPYCNATGWTCLHEAVKNDRKEFVEFILQEPKLQKLVNMRNMHGDTALHLAVQKCNPKMVTSLLLHKALDVTVINNCGEAAAWKLNDVDNNAKTLSWNEVSMLMLDADRGGATDIYNLHEEVKDKITNKSRKSVKSLTQTYTSNTSLVAILIAAITFTAAFTLPGGYSNDVGAEGNPIMARKLAFKAFLIADTLAMSSSLAVAFICVIVRWEDFEFLLYYRSFTKKLMWFAYMATTIAFATGLYTVLAPCVPWLAIAICFSSVLLPIVTMLLGEWPVWKLRFRLREVFNSDLVDMV